MKAAVNLFQQGSPSGGSESYFAHARRRPITPDYVKHSQRFNPITQSHRDKDEAYPRP